MSKLIGDVEKFNRIIMNLGSNITSGLGKAGLRTSRLMLNSLREHIEAQDLDWAPLSEDYLERKEKRGEDVRAWVQYGTLYHALAVKLRPEGGYMVGILKGTTEPNGTSTDIVAKTLEYGSDVQNIEARPLFRPTREEHLATLKAAFLNDIKRKIK
jgi:hypothetical protein